MDTLDGPPLRLQRVSYSYSPRQMLMNGFDGKVIITCLLLLFRQDFWSWSSYVLEMSYSNSGGGKSPANLTKKGEFGNNPLMPSLSFLFYGADINQRSGARALNLEEADEAIQLFPSQGVPQRERRMIIMELVVIARLIGAGVCNNKSQGRQVSRE